MQKDYLGLIAGILQVSVLFLVCGALARQSLNLVGFALLFSLISNVLLYVVLHDYVERLDKAVTQLKPKTQEHHRRREKQ